MDNNNVEKCCTGTTKSTQSGSWTPFVCSVTGFALMFGMSVLYLHRCVTMRWAQERHIYRIYQEMALTFSPDIRSSGPECATLVVAHGISGYSSDFNYGLQKMFYTPNSHSCYCSQGQMQLDTSDLKNGIQNARKGGLFIFEGFSCKDVQRFNADAAIFTGIVAATWLCLLFTHARRKSKIRKIFRSTDFCRSVNYRCRAYQSALT